MNNVKKIIKNTGASFFTRVSTPASSFILVFFIARILGVSGLGKFSSALALLYIFQAFSGLGFSHLITREVAQNKSNVGKYIINGSFILLIFSSLMAGAMCLTINLITEETDTIYAVYILSISLVPYSLAIVFNSVFRAFEKFEYITISSVAGSGFKLFFGLLILFHGYGLLALMIAVLVAYFFSFFISLYCVLRLVDKIFQKIDFLFCKWIIKASPYFALILILSTIRWNIDVLILAKMMSETEVGFYSAAFKLMNICKLGLSSYIMAIQPVIFRLYKSSYEEYHRVCEDSIRYLFILMIPIVTGTMLLSDHFVLLIFEQEFLPAANVLRIIIWILVFSGANLIFANALIASNNQKINFQANFAAMISNICLNLLLIPKYGFIGASIASIFASIILLSYQYFFVSRHLFKVRYIYLIIKPLIAAVLMGVCVQLMKESNLFLIILTAGIVYIITIFALKTFSPKDVDRLRKLFKRKVAA